MDSGMVYLGTEERAGRGVGVVDVTFVEGLVWLFV